MDDIKAIVPVLLAGLSVAGLTALETAREPLLKARVDAWRRYCIEKERLRHPKDREMTDFDRQTMVQAAVAEIQADYEYLAGLEKLVAERVDLLKLMMEQ